MPVAERGYRSWPGPLESPATRWWVIARTDLARQLRKKIVRRALLLAWLPALFYGGVFLAIGWLSRQGISGPDQRPDMAQQFLFGVLGNAVARLAGDPELHPGIWSILFTSFFTATQLTAALVMITLTAPGLVSEDIRGRTFLLFFSRPLTRWDYILGKLSVPVAAALSVTLLPVLTVYLASLCLVPSPNLLAATWTIPAKALLASVAIAVPASLLALFLSSLVRESRYALVGWLALLLVPAMIGGSSRSSGEEDRPVSLHGNAAAAVRRVFDVPGVLESTGFFRHISDRTGFASEHQLQKLLRSFTASGPAAVPAAVLGGIALLSLAGLSLRVKGRQIP